MEISVIGTGYVGLVSGVCLAEKGHNVICVDIDQEKVAKINAGVSPIYERGLDELLDKHVKEGFKATTDLAQSVMDTRLSLIAVGTPFDGERIDLTYIKKLDEVYTEARYPSDLGLMPYGKPTIEETEKLYEFAKNLYDTIVNFLKK